MREAMNRWLQKYQVTFSTDTAHKLCNNLELDEEKVDGCLMLCYQMEKGEISNGEFTAGLSVLTGKEPEDMMRVLRSMKSAVPTPEVTIPNLNNLLAHLREAPLSKSSETYLLKSFGKEILQQAHKEGLVTRSPKGIYSILLKGQELIKGIPKGKANLFEIGKQILREGITIEPAVPKAEAVTEPTLTDRVYDFLYPYLRDPDLPANIKLKVVTVPKGIFGELESIGGTWEEEENTLYISLADTSDISSSDIRSELLITMAHEFGHLDIIRKGIEIDEISKDAKPAAHFENEINAWMYGKKWADKWSVGKLYGYEMNTNLKEYQEIVSHPERIIKLPSSKKPEAVPEVILEVTPEVEWTNIHGKQGTWTTIVDGQPLRIDFFPPAMDKPPKHYRITSRYSNEMFAHQFYATLKEAQTEAVRMLKAHLVERRAQGYETAAERKARLEVAIHKPEAVTPVVEVIRNDQKKED